MSKPPYLGLDIGLRRTGVALSEGGVLATPLCTVEWNQPHSHVLIEELIRLILQHQVATIIAGLPLGENDEETEQAAKTTRVVDQLKEALAKQALLIPVVTINEFHTTKDALAHYPDVDKDAAAAAIILQDYLDLEQA